MVNKDYDVDMNTVTYIVRGRLKEHSYNVTRYHESAYKLVEAMSFLVGKCADNVEVHDEYVRLVFHDGVPDFVLDRLEPFSYVVRDTVVRVAIPVPS